MLCPCMSDYHCQHVHVHICVHGIGNRVPWYYVAYAYSRICASPAERLRLVNAQLCAARSRGECSHAEASTPSHAVAQVRRRTSRSEPGESDTLSAELASALCIAWVQSRACELTPSPHLRGWWQSSTWSHSRAGTCASGRSQRARA